MLPCNDEASSVANDFFMHIFKVQPCAKRGAHDWSSCPYAHPKEKARRRDPRVYKYASTPCPESLKGMGCARGVDCPYAHSVYEYWLHPSRFRTQMCKKGNQCNRSLCFFAHSASELRFPDTSDDVEAAAADAAAAAATAGALPLVATNNQSLTCDARSMMMVAPNAAAPGAAAAAVVNGGSINGPPAQIGLAGMCGDGSSMQMAHNASAGHCAVASDDSSYGLVRMTGQQQQVQQMQGTLMGYNHEGYNHGSSYMSSLGPSDPNVYITNIAMQQPQGAAGTPPPLMPGAYAAANNSCAPSAGATWLQLAAASQLPASQIMSGIRIPTQQIQQAARQLVPGVGNPAVDAALAHMSTPPSITRMGGGAACNTASDNLGSTGCLSSNMAAMSLVDDSSSSSSCLTAVSDYQCFAALNAAAAAAAAPGRPLQMGAVLSQPNNSSNLENFRLLQQLQGQQQLSRLSNTASSMSCGLSLDSRQGSFNM